MFFSLLQGLLACNGSPLSGKVTDGGGQPIENVTVQVEKTDCSGSTDAAGEYSIVCNPAQGTLLFNKKSFIGGQATFDTATKDGLNVPPIALTRIPGSTGLFLMVSGKYQPLSTAVLTRQLSDKKQSIQRSYCINSETMKEATTLPSGLTSIYDHQASDWRLFRLDANRCAYSDTRKASGRWVVGYRDKPNLKVTSLNDALSVHTADLAPGYYFVADWKGFFVATEPTQTSKQQYSGYWFQVEG